MRRNQEVVSQDRRQQVAAAFFACAFAACGGTKPDAPLTAAHSAKTEVLPFIHDDYPSALKQAKAQHKPLFVDAWAPWCHSCQSLRTFVLTDQKLAPLANDFVWLSVDTEKDQNAEWVAQHPHSALPTLWVIDPATDRPILKWAGTVTADELKTLLNVAVVGDAAAKGEGMEATAAFVRGNHALAAGDAELAEKEHRAALAAAGKDHPHRARIVEALVSQLSLRKQHAACADVAAQEAASLPLGTSRASTTAMGLGCAREAKNDQAESSLLNIALEDARRRDTTLLADDRSALYEEVVETIKAKDEAKGKALAAEWATFLDGEAAKAPNNDARASLDPLRLGAYLAVGDPARAIPMLEKSERDFPADYNPPARLGRVYLELKKLDDADKAADRAIQRVYGPRAMRVYGLKADIAKARGDKAAEITALETALARSEKSVLTEGQKGVREGLVKRLGKLR
jgi:thioredoxin-like negative regulator of GroEL